MRNGSVLVVVALAMGYVLGVGTLAFPQDKKPPTATRAGHRTKALDLVKRAQAELKEAVAFAKANPPAAKP